jgi:hypothetical protein
MNPTSDPPKDWNPKEAFERVAQTQGRSPEQLRERLGELAGQIGREPTHLSFEVLRDFQLLSQRGSLSEEDQSHLERCSFCSQLLTTLEPSRRQVEEFATAALAAFSVPDRTAADEANVKPTPKQTPGSRRSTKAGAARFAVVLGVSESATEGAVLTDKSVSAAKWQRLKRNPLVITATAVILAVSVTWTVANEIMVKPREQQLEQLKSELLLRREPDPDAAANKQTPGTGEHASRHAGVSESDRTQHQNAEDARPPFQ